MSRLDRLNFGGAIRGMIDYAAGLNAVMFSGAGSGLYEPTLLGTGQRARSIVLQDTRRSIDWITWRRLLAFARQLHTNCGEIRGPVLERATLANSGGWVPRHIGKNTPKAVKNKYEEWAWNWMKVCDIRGQPYDFFTDMYLASIGMDRDGEAVFIPTVNRSGDPRIQWVANHRIYSHTNVYTVNEKVLPDGSLNPYYGMKINNGVVFDDQSSPVAAFVLEESMQFTQAIKGRYIPINSISINYNPDWVDQGRGVTAYAHGIKRIFDLDDVHGYLLLGIKRDAALQIIRESASGKVDKTASYITGGTSPAGTPISLEEMQGGGLWDVQVGKGAYQIAPVGNPRAESQEYMESVYVGVYQGLEWPYEYSRISKEARGANIRVTVEKINHSVRKHYGRTKKSAVRALGYGVGFAVNRGELPPGEWWAFDFPQPPEMTADKYREFQEAREEYKLGTAALQMILAQRGADMEDLRDMRDEDIDDLLTRVKALQAKHPTYTEKEILDLYQQRSPNISKGIEADVADATETDGTDGAGAKPKNKTKPKGTDK